MRKLLLALMATGLSAPAFAQQADTEYFSFGGDEYVAGQYASVSTAPANDAFAAGFDAKISAPVGGDAHAAGYNVAIDAAVTGNVYAGGFSVTVSAPVGEDVTAAGNTVSVLASAPISGNARLAGQSVTVNGPVAGSVLIAAQSATLAAAVGGDMQFTGVSLNFASGARVDGTLTIRAPRAIEVPASVAPANRVVFEQVEYAERVTGPAQVALEAAQKMSPWVVIVPIIVWNVILLVIGLIAFAVFPKRTQAVYDRSVGKPWYTLWVGIIGMSALLGFFALLCMTLLGIPLVILYVFVFAVAWVLAQVAGAFVIGTRILAAFNLNAMAIVKQLVGLFIGLVIVWVLGLIPFLGYLVWLAVLVFGIGGLARTIVEPMEAGGEAAPVAA